MNHFQRKNGELYAEDVSLAELAAAVGTPTYVYSRATLSRHFAAVDGALSGLPHTVCYAVKACSNLSVLALLARLGSGFDIVSLGELRRVQAAGGDVHKVVFSGVGKRDDEIAAALQAGVLCLNVESADELDRVTKVAQSLGIVAPISLRVNPDVDPRTHKYIATGLRESKFGIAMKSARDLYVQASRNRQLRLVGIDCHIGSQILELAPFAEAIAKVLELEAELRTLGIHLAHIDVGGGLGIPYDGEQPASPQHWGDMVRSLVAPTGLHVIVEPGRVIVGNAGLLLTQVIGKKQNQEKEFVIVDAAMNDLLRPALYDAWHAIEPVAAWGDRPSRRVDVVGPVCESGDFLGLDRALPDVQPGELLGILGAGAYGMAMASNYNARPRPAEVLVDGADWQVIRTRETLADLWRGELVPAGIPRPQ